MSSSLSCFVHHSWHLIDESNHRVGGAGVHPAHRVTDLQLVPASIPRLAFDQQESATGWDAGHDIGESWRRAGRVPSPVTPLHCLSIDHRYRNPVQLEKGAARVHQRIVSPS